MQLTVLMGDSMFVAKVPGVDAHPNTLKPWVLLCLLPRITVGVVEEVFRFLGPRNREGIPHHYKEIGNGFGAKHGCTSENNSTRANEGLFVVSPSTAELCLQCFIAYCRFRWTGMGDDKNSSSGII